MAAAPPDPTLIDKVVIANRILYDQGVGELDSPWSRATPGRFGAHQFQ